MLKARAIASVFLIINLGISAASAQTNCNGALIKDTYQSNSQRLRDWRLAKYVSRDQWEQVHSSGSGNAVIYGVPVGGSYEDFKNYVDKMLDISNESLSESQRDNILWTGISNITSSNYLACLNSQVFSKHGLHAGVVNAQDFDVTIRISWDQAPDVINLTWSGTAPPEVTNALPATLKRGDWSIVLPRPARQYTIVANGSGWATEPIVISPLPQIPPPPELCAGSTFINGMSVRIPRDTLCRQRVSYDAFGSFASGCGGHIVEAAVVQLASASGRQNLSTWQDSNFGNAHYTGLNGSTEIYPGDDATIELVRTASSCSNPSGPVGMNVTVTKHR